MSIVRSSLLTHSRLAASRRCPRLHEYVYNQGVRPVRVDEALRFGAIMAAMKEAYRRAWPSGSLEAAHVQLARLSDEQCDPFLRQTLSALIDGYDARWREEDLRADARFLEVEQRFQLPLRNPATNHPSRTFEMAGKVDAIQERCQLEFQGVCVVEDKTSSEDIAPGSEYWRRLRIDGQVSHYVIGAEALLGRPVDGVLYDVIGKPTIRPAKATPPEQRKYTKAGALYANQRAEDESPDEFAVRLRQHIADNPDRYFQRTFVVRLEDELREYLQEIWWEADLMRERVNRDVHPRNPDGCRHYGRLCAFFDVCTRAASLDDGMLFRKVDSVHPELEEAPDVANVAE